MTVPHDRRAPGGAGARSPIDPSGEDPDLDRRLRAADPLAGLLPDRPSAILVHRLAADTAEISTTAVRQRRQHRRRTALTALLAAAVLLSLAAASPVIAERFTAWTGIHGSGFGEEDTSEWLLSSAPDYLEAVESLRPAYMPLPAGYEWREAVAIFTAQDLREPTRHQVTGIKMTYHLYALCAWEADWLAGQRAGDTDRVRNATRVLVEMPSWPDAHTERHSDGGASLRRIATAAANGDAGPLRQDVDVNCAPSWTRNSDR